MNPAPDPAWQGSHPIFRNPRFAELFARHTGQERIALEGGFGFLSHRPLLGPTTLTVPHVPGPGPVSLAPLIEQARALGAARLEVITLSPPALPGPHAHRPLETRILDLREDEGRLWEQVGPNTRRKIRRAKKSGVTAVPGRDSADLESFWRIYCRTAERKGFPRQPRPLVEALFHEEDLTTLLLARREGTVVGGMLFWTEAYPVYWIGGFERIAEAPYLGTLTLWEALRHFRERGFPLLDLGGTDPAPGHGPTAFKDTFHGETRRSQITTLRIAPLRGWLLDRGEGIVRHVRKRVRR